MIGPLLNPAAPAHLLFGVADPSLMEVMAGVLVKMGTTHSVVFHGQGIDELSLLGPCQVIEIENGEMKKWILNPEEYGFKLCTLSDLQGGDAKTNVSLLKEAMTTGRGFIADTLALNGAMALYVYGKVPLKEGIRLAKKNMEEGTGWIF